MLRPGEMSVHHVNTIHGSLPNRSELPRIGLSVSYITPAAGPSKSPVVRVRGTANDHEFDLLTEPPSGGLAESIAAHHAFISDRGHPPVKHFRP